MLRVCNDAHKLIFFWSIVILSGCESMANATISLANNDPYPMFTAHDPHSFLHTQQKLLLKKFISQESFWKEHVQITASAFGQNAHEGRGLCGERNIGGFPVELGDISGRWNMIALLFGQTPSGMALTPTLQNARNVLFPGLVGPIEDADAIDPQQLFGNFSIPLKYQKRGLRFDFSAQIVGDFGINLQAGVADISQCVELTLSSTARFIDLTAHASNLSNPTSTDPSTQLFRCTNLSVGDVQCTLMDELEMITRELCLDICNFKQLSVEDIYVNFYWRHAYPVVRCTKESSFRALIIPYFNLGGTLAAGKKKNFEKAFSLAAGNNDHNAIDFTAGINIDIPESIEFGIEAGITNFFERDFCNVPMPTSRSQSGIYSFKTDISVSPGITWHFGAKIGAYHLLECLSFWSQYIIVDHHQDRICLKHPDQAFHPEVLEKRSKYQNQLMNIGLIYDISSHVAINFLWQAPIGQKNSYKSTTVLFGLQSIF